MNTINVQARFLVSMMAMLVAGLWSQPAALADSPDEPAIVELDFSNVGDTKVLTRDPLTLILANNTADPVLVDLQARAISGGDDATKAIGRVSLRAFDKTFFEIDPAFLSVNPDARGFSSQLLISGRILGASGQLLGRSKAPSLFYHRDDRGSLYVYRTLINSGMVGRIERPIPKEFLDPATRPDAISLGKPGPEPAPDGQTPKMSPVPIELKKAGPQGFVWWVQVCVLLKVDYTDVGIGEDFWKDNQDKNGTGAWVRLRDSNQNVVHDYFTGDGYDNNDNPGGDDPVGCTPWKVSANLSIWTLFVQSKASVRSNNIDVFRKPAKEELASWVTIVDLKPGRNFVSIPFVTRESNVLAAASYALLVRNGGVFDSYKIFTGDTYSTSYNDPSNLSIHINGNGGDRKFTVAHEMGHGLLHRKMLDKYGIDDVSLDASEPCQSPVPANLPPNSNGSHRMASKEYSSGAFHEGFADFYSLITWNSPSDSQAVYSRSSNTYEAEPGPGNIWMRFHCEAPYPGYGNETDWMRFFWAFHRTALGNVPFLDILGMLKEISSPIAQLTAYDLLRNSAAHYPKGTANEGMYESTFLYYADLKGIDY
jgi:hypothetical protein